MIYVPAGLDLRKVICALKLLTSDKDGEVLAAAAAVNRMLKTASMIWNEILLPHMNHIASTTLPIAVPLSRWRCASAAAASGKMRSMTTRNRPSHNQPTASAICSACWRKRSLSPSHIGLSIITLCSVGSCCKRSCWRRHARAIMAKNQRL